MVNILIILSPYRLREAALLVLAMVVIAFSVSPDQALAATRKASPKINKLISPRESAMINSLLIQARQAHDRWDKDKAKAFLFQARLINPAIPDPAWLMAPPGPKIKKHKPLTREQLIARVLAEPGGSSFKALEEYLKMHPQDEEARKILLQAAISAGAVTALQRISVSDAQKPHEDDWLIRFLKWVFLPLALAGLIWQTYRLWIDLREP